MLMLCWLCWGCCLIKLLLCLVLGHLCLKEAWKWSCWLLSQLALCSALLLGPVIRMDAVLCSPLLRDLQHVPHLFVHSLYNREKNSSIPSQAIVMMNMLLIVMNSYQSCKSHISIWDKWQAAHRKGLCTKAFTGRTASFTSCWALPAADHNEQLRPWSWRIDILCALFLSSWWNGKCYLTTS